MIMLYDVELAVKLEPEWHISPPRVIVSCHDQIHDIRLDRPRTVRFAFRAEGQQTLQIQLTDKTDEHSRPDLGLDQAVMISAISFFGIYDPRFVWTGVYRPEYPEPWYTQQIQQGQAPQAELINVDRLGWNGQWQLEFDLPVFTWIHHVQNLGWIYR